MPFLLFGSKGQHDAEQREQARRQSIEDELAAMKARMGLRKEK